MSETQTKTSPLAQAATKYAAAKAGDVIHKVGHRTSGAKPGGAAGAAAEKLSEGASPAAAAAKGVGTGIKDKIQDVFKSSGSTKRPTNIVEDLIVGVPIDIAFAAWTQYEEFASFTKGVQQVTRGETEEGEEPGQDEETRWTAKIFLSTRSWNSTTTDYDPPNRIAWTSEGEKGSVDGTVTFTPINDNATLIVLVLEYWSKGPIEWIGNRWRAVGRRARLDLKHFRRYVMRADMDELRDVAEEQQPAEEPEAARE